MNLCTFALATLVAAPNFALAATWVVASENTRATYFVDRDSIVMEPSGLRKAWVAMRNTEMEKDYNNQDYLIHVSLQLFNCRQRTSGGLQSTKYKDAARTEVVGDTTRIPRQEVEFNDVVPDSFGEAALNMVCSHKIGLK